MMKQSYIKTLITKFFDGETSLAEEQCLYAYFSGQNVDASLQHYRQLFIDLQQLLEQQNRVGGRHLRRWVAGIAASVLLLAGGYTAWWHYENHQLDMHYGGSYMIVDGHRIDNLSELRPHIERTLAEARHIEQTVETLPSVEEIEKEVMNHVSDPEERARIRQLLN